MAEKSIVFEKDMNHVSPDDAQNSVANPVRISFPRSTGMVLARIRSGPNASHWLKAAVAAEAAALVVEPPLERKSEADCGVVLQAGVGKVDNKAELAAEASPVVVADDKPPSDSLPVSSSAAGPREKDGEEKKVTVEESPDVVDKPSLEAITVSSSAAGPRVEDGEATSNKNPVSDGTPLNVPPKLSFPRPSGRRGPNLQGTALARFAKRSEEEPINPLETATVDSRSSDAPSASGPAVKTETDTPPTPTPASGPAVKTETVPPLTPTGDGASVVGSPGAVVASGEAGCVSKSAVASIFGLVLDWVQGSTSSGTAESGKDKGNRDEKIKEIFRVLQEHVDQNDRKLASLETQIQEQHVSMEETSSLVEELYSECIVWKKQCETLAATNAKLVARLDEMDKRVTGFGKAAFDPSSEGGPGPAEASSVGEEESAFESEGGEEEYSNDIVAAETGGHPKKVDATDLVFSVISGEQSLDLQNSLNVAHRLIFGIEMDVDKFQSVKISMQFGCPSFDRGLYLEVKDTVNSLKAGCLMKGKTVQELLDSIMEKYRIPSSRVGNKHRRFWTVLMLHFLDCNIPVCKAIRANFVMGDAV